MIKKVSLASRWAVVYNLFFLKEDFMSKRYVIAGLVATVGLLSTSVFAADAVSATIGTVNMQQVLQTAPQVKKINDQLQSQFAKRKTDILAQAKVLQSDMGKVKDVLAGS